MVLERLKRRNLPSHPTQGDDRLQLSFQGLRSLPATSLRSSLALFPRLTTCWTFDLALTGQEYHSLETGNSPLATWGDQIITLSGSWCTEPANEGARVLHYQHCTAVCCCCMSASPFSPSIERTISQGSIYAATSPDVGDGHEIRPGRAIRYSNPRKKGERVKKNKQVPHRPHRLLSSAFLYHLRFTASKISGPVVR